MIKDLFSTTSTTAVELSNFIELSRVSSLIECKIKKHQHHHIDILSVDEENTKSFYIVLLSRQKLIWYLVVRVNDTEHFM